MAIDRSRTEAAKARRLARRWARLAKDAQALGDMRLASADEGRAARYTAQLGEGR